MPKLIGHIFAAIGCGLLAACIIAAFLAGKAERRPLVCKGVSVTVKDRA